MSLKSLMPIGRDRSVTRREHSPFTTLQREIDRVFDDFARGFTGLPRFSMFAGPAVELMPSMDVTETDKEIEITAELPGLEEKDVQISITDNLLTIKGEKRDETEQKDKDYRLVERTYGSFSRVLELPAGIDPDAIKATMAKGVLTITVSKPAPAQAKKVDVKAAA